jgi:hypothetical protein
VARRIGVALASLVVLTLALGALLHRQEEQRLDKSLSVLVDKLWGVPVLTESRVTGWSLFESEGVWLLRWEGPAETSQAAFLVNEMSIADASDHNYYRQKMTDVLTLRFSLESYSLFRGEFPLGDGTVCPALACNLEIFVKEGDPMLIVRISTT